jgi:hypothetical protein
VSAGDKLGVLDEAMPRAEAPSSDSPITTVRFVLPQIMAVVERLDSYYERRGFCLVCQAPDHKPDCALAALDAALGGGDTA